VKLQEYNTGQTGDKRIVSSLEPLASSFNFLTLLRTGKNQIITCYYRVEQCISGAAKSASAGPLLNFVVQERLLFSIYTLFTATTVVRSKKINRSHINERKQYFKFY
jgi:hypothetical protein